MKKLLIFLTLCTQLSYFGSAQSLTRKHGYPYKSIEESNYFEGVYNFYYTKLLKYSFIDGNDLYVYNSDFSLYAEYIDLYDIDEVNLEDVYVTVTQDVWDDDEDIEIEIEKKYRDGETDYEDIVTVYDHNLTQLHQIFGYFDEVYTDIIDNEIVYIVNYSDQTGYNYSLDSTVFYKVRDVISSSSNNVARVNNDMLSASPNPSPRNARISVKYVLPDNANTGELIFYSLRGKELKRMRVGKHVDHVDVSTSGMPRGMCVYKLKTSEGIVYSNKLMVH